MKVLKAINLQLSVAAVFVLVLFLSGNALAARAASQNIIYFDANLNVIGQHAEYCNNYQYEGGDVVNAVAYLEITGGCGELIRECHFEWQDEYPGYYVCTGYHVNYAVEAVFMGGSNYTIEDACNVTGACSSREPILMVGRGFDLVQIWPTP